jgi:hypothetical protein
VSYACSLPHHHHDCNHILPPTTATTIGSTIIIVNVSIAPRCYRFIDLGIAREFSHFDGQKDWMPPPPNGIPVSFKPNNLGQSVLRALPPAAHLASAAAAAARAMGLEGKYVALHVRRNDM